MEIEVFRRKRGSSGQWKSHSKPYIKLEMPRGQITVFKNAMDMMGFKHGEAVMFGVNRKSKCGYIFKEDPQDDSYYLRDNGKGYSRFTSKDLMLFLVEIFSIPEKKVCYFQIESKPNDEGKWKFTLE